MSPAEALVKFYTDLRWEPKNQLLDPKKVRISEKDYHTKEPIRAKAKIRYSHKMANATVSMEQGRLRVVFDEKQRAITPGQAIVVYDGDFVLCGGTII